MKISILIIAHNEEAHIRECIESVLSQSVPADEIIVIAHNCTDTTENIVQEYSSITLHKLKTNEAWPIPAREYGFQKVTGEIIACIDGDSYVTRTWLQEITQPFQNKEIHSVSGYPILIGNRLFSFVFFLQWLPILRNIFALYFWWGNFACRRLAYEQVGWMKECRKIGKSLQLNYPAEDCILSFLLQKEWKLVFVRKAQSYVYPGRFFDGENRWEKQRQDLKKIKKYFKK